MAPKTLLVVLAHPDDELVVAGTLCAHRAAGHRVVVVYLTRGEATAAFGPLPPDDVAARRVRLAERAARILDIEHRFLGFTDTEIVANPTGSRAVADVVAEIRPDALLTWGRMWVKGMRHPDHMATGAMAVDAITLARIARVVEPTPPHRDPCPVFTVRGVHSTLPSVWIDVSDHVDRIFELADVYFREIGFGQRAWLEARLRGAASPPGVDWAERLDTWETEPGVIPTLFHAVPIGGPAHPTRPDVSDP